MLTWIVLAALAQFITALIVLVDKYVLVSQAHLGKPVVYAFYVSALSGVVIVLVPFGVISVPSLTVLALSLLALVPYIGPLIILFFTTFSAGALLLIFFHFAFPHEERTSKLS